MGVHQTAGAGFLFFNKQPFKITTRGRPCDLPDSSTGPSQQSSSSDREGERIQHAVHRTTYEMQRKDGGKEYYMVHRLRWFFLSSPSCSLKDKNTTRAFMGMQFVRIFGCEKWRIIRGTAYLVSLFVCLSRTRKFNKSTRSVVCRGATTRP